MNKTLTKRLQGWARRLGAAALAGVLACTLAVGAFAAGGLELSTDYPGIAARAGDSLTFDLDLTNTSGAGLSTTLSVASIPEGWTGYFTGGGSRISRVYAKSGLNDGAAVFNLEIPADAANGSYTVALAASAAGASSTLELELTLDEEQVGGSALATEYAQQEGDSDTTFTFSTTLTNNTPNEQSYSLSANPPEGWTVGFQPSGESTQVAAVTVDARGSQGLSIRVNPPETVEAGEYTIPVSAISSAETLSDELTVVITGTHEVVLATPSGRLSFDAKANQERAVTLSITNTGNVDLQNLNLTSTPPSGWSVTFSESTIDLLEAGATKEVTAYVKPAEDALSGDYALTLKLSNSDASDQAEFRVTVKTETLWGVVGVLIILAALAGLAYVFRKYGRR